MLAAAVSCSGSRWHLRDTSRKLRDRTKGDMHDIIRVDVQITVTRFHPHYVQFDAIAKAKASRHHKRHVTTSDTSLKKVLPK